MKTTALLLTIMVALVFFVRASNEIAKASVSLATLAAQEAELTGKTAKLEDRLRTAKNAIAEAEREEAALATNRSAPGKTNTALPATARMLSPTSLIANDQKKLAQYAKEYRENLDLTLGGLFKRFHLTPEQAEKIAEIRARAEINRIELRAAAESQGLDMNSEAYKKLESDQRKQIPKVEAEIFGPGEELTRFQNASRAAYLRETVQRIASSEMGSEQPATFAQVENAIDIILANSQRRALGDPRKMAWQIGGWSWQDWAEINWSAVEPQLQGILSPGQFDALRQFLRTQETWTAVAKRNATNQGEAARLVRQAGG